MAREITDSCVSCGTCADICPAGAVTEGKDKYVIDAAKCTDCGECQENCQENAILGESAKEKPLKMGR
jgi:ferredoxin